MKIVDRILAFVSVAAILIGLTGLLLTSYISLHRDPRRHDLPMLIPNINSPDKLLPIIRLHDKKTKEFFCSGAVISRNYAVTAGHCLEDRNRRVPSIRVYTADNQDSKVDATAVFYDERSDQGLILGDFSEFNVLRFVTDPTAILEIMTVQERPMAACGFPYGGGLFCSPFSERHQGDFQISGQGFLYPGMSGGPVVDIGSGLLLGTNSAASGDVIIIAPLIELLKHAEVGGGEK